MNTGNKPGPSDPRGVLAELPHTTYRLPDRAPLGGSWKIFHSELETEGGYTPSGTIWQLYPLF